MAIFSSTEADSSHLGIGGGERRGGGKSGRGEERGLERRGGGERRRGEERGIGGEGFGDGIL